MPEKVGYMNNRNYALKSSDTIGRLDVVNLIFLCKQKHICYISAPILDECLQQGGTYVLGPVWVSTGEGFSPSGTRDFLLSIQVVLKARLKEAKLFRQEVGLTHGSVVVPMFKNKKGEWHINY